MNINYSYNTTNKINACFHLYDFNSHFYSTRNQNTTKLLKKIKIQNRAPVYK